MNECRHVKKSRNDPKGENLYKKGREKKNYYKKEETKKELLRSKTKNSKREKDKFCLIERRKKEN